MKSYYVYLITFPNGKKYCGLTCNLAERKKSHRRRALQKKFNFPVCSAICKYGFQTLAWEVLAEGLERTDALALEVKTIKNLNLTDRAFGYNLTAGGDGSVGHSPSEATRAKLSIAAKGHHRNTPEQLKILSELMSKKNSSSSFANKAKQGRSQSVKYQTWSLELGKQAILKQGKPLVCLNDNLEFESIKQASRYYSIGSTHISRVLRGISKHAKGLKFQYKAN